MTLAMLRGLRIRTVLIVGFSLTAGTWLFAGYYFSHRLRELESDAAALSRRYTAAQELLVTAGNHVDRASIQLRDGLLDPRPVAEKYRQGVEAAFGAAEALLAQYIPVLDSRSERDRAARLRANIQELRIAHLDVLATNPREWRLNARDLLNDRVRPKRDAAEGVASDLQKLNRDAFVEQQADAARLYAAVHQRLWRTLGFSILASFIIGLLSALQAGRLERRLRTQQEKDARTAVELQHLSTRLVNAQEEERRSIARELHDEIGQILTAVKMELSHAQRQAAAGNPVALDDARSITDQALVAVRDMSHLLHPPQLDELGLPAAIDSYVQALGRRLDTEFHFVPQPIGSRLPAEVELAVYRTVQEGLTNVVRHARARSCHVTLRRLPSSVVVGISDDGVGFATEKRTAMRRESGLGLVGIRERARELGGSVHVQSTPGQGTVLTAEFPLHEIAAHVGTAELAASEAEAS